MEFRPVEGIVISERVEGRLAQLERQLVGGGWKDGLVLLLVGRGWEGGLILLVGLEGRQVVLDLLGGSAVGRRGADGGESEIGLSLLSTLLSDAQLQLFAQKSTFYLNYTPKLATTYLSDPPRLSQHL